MSGASNMTKILKIYIKLNMILTSYICSSTYSVLALLQKISTFTGGIKGIFGTRESQTIEPIESTREK
jgi:hypothetical protein